MSVIKLFRTDGNSVSELEGGTVQLERTLQQLVEENMEALLGVRFLASEFPTTNHGRMDSLGLDENGSPVIVEYKRQRNENVINQGLFYLDWLMDHRMDFQWLVLEKFGKEAADNVDWSSPRLICIAGDFTKFDAHAVNQMDKSIELMRYRRFGEELLLLEVITATSGDSKVAKRVSNKGSLVSETKPAKYKTVSDYMGDMDPELASLYEAVREFLESLGDDVQVKVLDFYIAFRRLRNFACVEVKNQLKMVRLYLKVEPTGENHIEGITRDVRKVGHFGTGDLEVSLSSLDDLERSKHLIEQSYENS